MATIGTIWFKKSKPYVTGTLKGTGNFSSTQYFYLFANPIREGQIAKHTFSWPQVFMFV